MKSREVEAMIANHKNWLESKIPKHIGKVIRA
jgi:hypothetical protein